MQKAGKCLAAASEENANFIGAYHMLGKHILQKMKYVW